MASPERTAQELLQRHGQAHAPIDVETIAHREGLRVVRRALETNTSGVLVRNGDAVVLGVNSSNHPLRQRFTIAHELGHYLLHEGRPLLVDSTVRINKRDNLSSTATNSEEIQANAFAANLLMPSDMVFAAVAASPAPLLRNPEQLAVHLARQFDVSEQAMSFRLHNLAIAT